MEARISRKVVALVMSAVLVVGLCPGAALAKTTGSQGEESGTHAASTSLKAAPNSSSSLTTQKAASKLRAQAKKKSKSKVTKYTYSAKALLSPIGNLLYVKTKNPDPFSFCLADKSNKYVKKSEGTAVYTVLDYKYADIKYEKAKTFRVKGGYIFYGRNFKSDGGTLTVQQRNSDDSFSDTKLKVKVPKLMTTTEYLIEKYAKGKSGFFEKLDAVQDALLKLSIYPRWLYSSKRTGLWPYLAVSPYSELGLNRHYDSLYKTSDSKLFCEELHPFVLDSLSFPDKMAAVAKQLNPKCTLEGAYNHWQVVVSLNGESREYGWAGNGGAGPIHGNAINKYFKFDNSKSDFMRTATIENLTKTYLDYIAKTERELAPFKAMLEGEGLSKAMGKGSWAYVGMEGGGNAFAYFRYSEYSNSLIPVSDTWVDGRYVDANEGMVHGAKYSDHPLANIVIRNKTFKDADGNTHTSDLFYMYNEDYDRWYAAGSDYGFDTLRPDGKGGWELDVPDDFVLTHSDVKALKVDRNTDIFPETGKRYDGYVKPGTPFKNTPGTSVKLAKQASVYLGFTKKLSAKVLPKSDIGEKAVTWTSLNPKVASVQIDGTVEGLKKGTAKIVARAVNGGCKAVCTVTVKGLRNIKKAKVGKIPVKKVKGTAIANDPVPVVRYNGKKLVKDRDYTVSYHYVKSTYSTSGSYKRTVINKLVITGKGIYKGKKSIKYKVIYQ